MVKVVVKVGGQGRGQGWRTRLGIEVVGTRLGVKGGVMIGGHKVGVKVWLSSLGVKGSGGWGSRSGAGVRVRERWVKVGGVGSDGWWDLVGGGWR